MRKMIINLYKMQNKESYIIYIGYICFYLFHRNKINFAYIISAPHFIYKNKSFIQEKSYFHVCSKNE